MRNIFAVIIFVWVAGCTNKPTDAKSNIIQFDLPKYTRELAKNMTDRQLEISKTFILNETSESKKYSSSDSLFWHKELAILEKINLNSPLLRGTFEVKRGFKDQFSNLLIDKYSFTTKGDIGIKKLLVYYLNNPKDIRQIKADLVTKNIISQSSSQLSVWINRYGNDLLVDSIEVISQDKTLMQPSRNYRSITKVLR